MFCERILRILRRRLIRENFKRRGFCYIGNLWEESGYNYGDSLTVGCKQLKFILSSFQTSNSNHEITYTTYKSKCITGSKHS
jgi:hypothetical protein